MGNTEYQEALTALKKAWQRFNEALTPAEVIASTYEPRASEIRHDELYLAASGRELDAGRLSAPRRPAINPGHLTCMVD